MNGPGWDTRSPGGVRPGGRDRLALAVGTALLVVAILAAVTGKVLASGPPTLSDSSPAADHIERAAPESSPEPVDPRSLFLDLPDPPKPAAPEPADDPETVASPEVAAPVRPVEKKRRADASGRGGGVAGRSSGTRLAGRAAAAPDIPVGEADAAAPPPAPAVRPGSGRAEDLLADPDCRFSDVARMDLEAGIVDEYLISALQAVCRKHSIYVNVFKTGHTFGPGFEEGPTIPVGYGNAGGYPNTHYFGRAADIWEVDGKPVEGNGADPSVVSVGRILAGLPSRNKPEVVIGPSAWNRALGYGPDQGWVLDGDQVSLHEDHLHIGYWQGDGTPPPQLFLSADHEHETSSLASSTATRAPARNFSAAGRDRTPPKLKETRQPAESSPPEPPQKRVAEERKEPREKPGPQKTVERRVQRPDATKPDTREPRTRQPEPEERTAPEKRKPEPEPPPEPEQTTPPEPEDTSQEEEETAVPEETTAPTEAAPEDSPAGGGTVVEDAGLSE